MAYTLYTFQSFFCYEPFLQSFYHQFQKFEISRQIMKTICLTIQTNAFFNTQPLIHRNVFVWSSGLAKIKRNNSKFLQHLFHS